MKKKLKLLYFSIIILTIFNFLSSSRKLSLRFINQVQKEEISPLKKKNSNFFSLEVIFLILLFVFIFIFIFIIFIWSLNKINKITKKDDDNVSNPKKVEDINNKHCQIIDNSSFYKEGYLNFPRIENLTDDKCIIDIFKKRLKEIDLYLFDKMEKFWENNCSILDEKKKDYFFALCSFYCYPVYYHKGGFPRIYKKGNEVEFDFDYFVVKNIGHRIFRIIKELSKIFIYEKNIFSIFFYNDLEKLIIRNGIYDFLRSNTYLDFEKKEIKSAKDVEKSFHEAKKSAKISGVHVEERLKEELEKIESYNIEDKKSFLKKIYKQFVIDNYIGTFRLDFLSFIVSLFARAFLDFFLDKTELRKNDNFKFNFDDPSNLVKNANKEIILCVYPRSVEGVKKEIINDCLLKNNKCLEYSPIRIYLGGRCILSSFYDFLRMFKDILCKKDEIKF